MSGVSNYSYTTLKQAIQDYTEVGSSVFTTTILDGFIMAAEMRINQELPMDADRFVQENNFVINKNTINSPAGALFIRGIEVFDSTTSTEGDGTWLEKKDQTYLSEYIDRLTGTEGDLTAQPVTGLPKYYAMFGGATGLTDSTSGGLYIAPTPAANYKFRIYYNKYPTGLNLDRDWETLHSI